MIQVALCIQWLARSFAFRAEKKSMPPVAGLLHLCLALLHETTVPPQGPFRVLACSAHGSKSRALQGSLLLRPTKGWLTPFRCLIIKHKPISCLFLLIVFNPPLLLAQSGTVCNIFYISLILSLRVNLLPYRRYCAPAQEERDIFESPPGNLSLNVHYR